VERLSTVDVSFLELEDHANRLHLGSIAILEGPAPSTAQMVAHLSKRLKHAPRCRQRLRALPMGVSRPIWVDATDFDAANHIRRTALVEPGGMDELEALVGRLMAEPLDRGRPLWELWIVDGVDDEHWAIVTKVHHAALGAGDLFSALLDAEPQPDPTRDEPAQWTPRPGPSNLDLVRDSVGDLLDFELPLSLAKAAVRAPLALFGHALTTARGLTSLGGIATPKTASTLAGPLSPHRNYRWFTWSLEEVQGAKDALGTTVNDVVLTAIALGFRDLLIARDVDPSQRRIRAMLPVSLASARSALDHDSTPRDDSESISALFAELPVAEADPAAALADVSRQTSRLASSGQRVAASTLTQLAGFAPPALLGLGMRAASRVASMLDEVAIDTVITNVPGPQESRWLLGRTLLHVFPYAPLAAPVRISVAVFSYDGELSFGITADRDAIPDLGDFTAGIEAGLLELVHLASEA
jgi:diacylglycerol O-acyltransferase